VAPSFHSRVGEKVEFLNYDLDTELSSRVKKIFLFTSDNDTELSQKNAKTISKRIKNIQVINCPGYGHFVPEHMGKSSFEELFEVLK
jgi:predicted alpha/beta hydrolase family esterase